MSGVPSTFKDSGLLVQEDPQECLEILKNAPIGFFNSEPEGRLLSANPAMARMLGFDSPQELVESTSDLSGQLYLDPAERQELLRLLSEHGEVHNY